MSTRTLPITAGSFEKVFTAVATKRTFRRKSQSGEIVKLVLPSGNTATWCAIACEALETETLGDTLRHAIQALSVKYREVLFLQDLKNLNTAETAWVLDITMEAVRSRLLRARMKVRNALASSLQPKYSEINFDFGNSCAHDDTTNLNIRERSRMGKARDTPLQECFGA